MCEIISAGLKVVTRDLLLPFSYGCCGAFHAFHILSDCTVILRLHTLNVPQRDQPLVPGALLLFWRQSVLIGTVMFFFSWEVKLKGQAEKRDTHTNSRSKELLAKGCQGCKRFTWLQGGDWAGAQKWELMRGSGQTNHTPNWQKSHKLALRPCTSSIPNSWMFSESQKIVSTDLEKKFLEEFRK